MKTRVVIWLLFMMTVLAGCSNVQESNQIKDTVQQLTRAQIKEIITATNESLIVDIDYSQVSKPDPAQQAEANERMRSLGEKYKGKVSIENNNVIIARVNGETITASDWYMEKNSKSVQAEYKHKPVPSNEEIFNNLIKTKVISSTARNLGLYPPKDQVNAYIADQRKCMEQIEAEEITVLLKTWDISEEEYLLLMKDRFTDSLAKANWGIYLEKYGNLHEDEQGYVVKSPLRIDDDIIMPLLEEAEVEVTSEGQQLGISYK